MTFEEAVSHVSLAIDAVGVAIMAAGTVVALARFAVDAVTGDGVTA